MVLEQVSTKMGIIDSSLYNQSFGNFPDGQCYAAGMSTMYNASLKGVSNSIENFGEGYRQRFFEARKAQFKALETTTGTGGATIQALIPVFIDPRIVDISRKQTPLTELVPRVSNQGIVAAYVRVTAKGAATTALEDGVLTEQNFTRVQANESIKYLYSIGRVTGPAQQAIPAFTLGGFNPTGSGLGGNAFSDASAPNAMQQEVLLAARALKELEENLIVNGNSTTSVGSGPNGSEFDGFVTLQSTTNQTDLSGAELTWDDVENTVKLAFEDGGQPNLAVASPSALVALRAIMIDSFRIMPGDNATELTFGISAQVVLNTIVGRIPVIPSRYLSDTASQRSIYFLDMDWIEMRVLLDMTFEELAKTNDSRKFMLKIYETLIVRAPEFNSFIDNIA
tara:strand:- start:222 stop:1406 length:1185 start_codon:yes stop_codon:yes gene_type:complete